MSIPTIVVSPSNIPSTIQFSTPFSYTFSNSDIYNQEEVPAYGGNQPIIVTTSSPYSPNYAYIYLDDARGFSVGSTRKPYTFDYISNASEFTFTVPNTGSVAKSSGNIKFSSNSWTFYRQVDGFGFNDYIIDTINNTYVLYAGYSFVGTPVTIRYVKQSNGFQVFSNSTLLFTEPPSDLTFRLSINCASFSEATFIVGSPNNLTPTYPLMTIFSGTSAEILSSSFITGSSTPQLTFSSSNGFQTIPSSNLTLNVSQEVSGIQIGIPSSNTFTVTPISITTSPTLGSTLSLYTYQPFSYTYSIGDAVNVLLQYNSNVTSSSLIPYISGDTFASTLGLTVPGTTTIRFDALLSNVIIASKQTTITTIAPIVTITPEIPTGSLNLYKYEPFSYVFTLNTESVGLVLQFNRSSSQISPYCTLSTDKMTLTYAGTYLTTSSSVVSLIVDVLYGTTIITTTTIRISIGKGRFFPPTSNQSYQMYQNEPLSTTFGSNPVFSTVSEIDSIVTIPSLPNGISFSITDANTAILQGTPTLPVAQATYTVFGSNSVSGNIVSTPIVVKVNSQQVLITPSSTTLSNLTIGTTVTPVEFVARQPVASTLSFQYNWDTLPDGFTFQTLDGSNIPQGYGSNTIQLAGAPTLTAAKSFASNSITSYSARLTATQFQTSGTRISGSSLITFSFGETVLFGDLTIPDLYATESINSKNVFFSASTFFNGANTSNIVSITATSLPVGLSLSSIITSNRVQLLGTPTVISSSNYSFTAINSSGIRRTQSFTIPILPDIVSFGSDTPDENTAFSFIVSKPITPIVFSATSSANKTPISWSLSLPTSYGLVLSSNSGSSITLSGTPTSPLSQLPVIITAIDTLGTIALRTILITIENDTFTWPIYAPTYTQNISIDSYQFEVITSSGRLIQSFTAVGLPPGLILSPSGILSGTPTVSTSGTFTLSASTGYVSPPTYLQTFSYTMVPDNVLTLLNLDPTPVPLTDTNGTLTFSISNVFRAISYSGFTATNAIKAGSIEPAELNPVITLVNNVLSGSITELPENPSFSFIVEGIEGSVRSEVYALLSIPDRTTAILTLRITPGFIYFSEPLTSSFTLFQYCPMIPITFSIPLAEAGYPYTYYYSTASNLPLGMTFETESTGTYATISGIPATYSDRPISVTVYAANGPNVISNVVNFRILTPNFINPQVGAGAYTAILRSDVEGNAAQNARDQRVFPTSDPLAGPLLAPRAPDVITQSNCFLGLCKKPCPTCRTMM
jgi:hypothetical protein